MTEPRKRSRSSAKAAGRQLENDLVACLNARKLGADRLRLKGANDEGDVRAELAKDHVFECKNTRVVSLGTWWGEAAKERDNAHAEFGWVIFKRHGIGDPDEQWALTTTGQLADLLSQIAKLKDTNAYLIRCQADAIQASSWGKINHRKGTTHDDKSI